MSLSRCSQHLSPPRCTRSRRWQHSRSAPCRAPKGTLPHRTVGWLWVALMVTVATTSFWIHDLRVWGQWSPIHLLSIFTLIMLPPAVIHAMRHRVKDHRKAMVGLFTGALVIAGLFTFWPGRIMHAVLFGD